MDWSIVSLICTEERFHKPALNKVIPHHYNNMILAMNRLFEMGYRRPGFVSCRNSLGRDNYAWFGAYYSFMMDRSIANLYPRFERFPVQRKCWNGIVATVRMS
ncbi:MAG: hypothetical protein LR015_08185 [Verrucomicrobia bacterium]|nr:hypothetical protein [Verrucomicrobiota bacterium]